MTFLRKFRPYRLFVLFLCILLSTVFLTTDPTLRFFFSPAQAATQLSITQGVKKTVLANGLTVLTKEVHTAPVVSVQVWYRVGSRNEPAGQNGISHQLEHLMFKGTSDRPIQFGRLFSALGSQSNAFTSYDETAYFGTVERDKLNALLALEADRMENSVIGDSQLTSEKRVVISELQGYENSPNYRLDRAVMKAAFPDRPYGLPVGGTKADVQSFTVEQVRDYYQQYYTPNNATLVVTGDFDTASTLKTIEQDFGKLPRRGTAEDHASAQASSQRIGQSTSSQTRPTGTEVARSPIVLQEPGSAALLEVVYPLPDIQHPDVPAIDLMDMVLTGGRSSRLYQALVEKGLASAVSAYPAEMIEPGWYDISVTVAQGKEMSQVQTALQEALTNLQQQPVSQAELQRAKTQLQASFVLGNQDISSQASQLAYNQTIAGDYRYSDRYLQAIAQVTPADIQRVAQTYLDPTQQTVGQFEPTLADGQPGTSSSSSSRITENFSPGEPVDPAEVARYLPPALAAADTTPQPLPEEVTLNNGLKVLLLKDSSAPTVNLSGHLDAGSAYDSEAKAGLALLTADNLLNGTRNQDALTLATALEDRGSSLNFGVNREGVNIQGNALATDLPHLVQTLAEVLQTSTFPTDQVELSRQRELTTLKAQLDNPQFLARRTFQQAIYPANHPFHTFPTEASLKGITQREIQQFYQTHYRPDSTVLALVGDFDPERVRSLLQTSFSNWQATGTRPTLVMPSINLPRRTTRINPTMPGKAEAVTLMGYGGIARKDPRFYAALVMNQILGGDTLASRLGTEVRDRQGLTYGIYSYFQTGINPGPFIISMQTAPEDANKAIDSTIALLQQFQQGITAAELENAKRSLISSYPVDLADPSTLVSEIASNAIDGLSREEIRQFPQRIAAVTLSEVQSSIQDLIHPDQMVIVTAGPGT
ncbi:MAG: insulinase family protein [Oculatellaceae cyanobacterium Prado106]|jgi:zinc protease|nr:insulinase family protein [Oculatellaceae cyanobacterium Prado106]